MEKTERQVMRSLGQAQTKRDIIQDGITYALNLYRLELYPSSPWNVSALNFDKLVQKALEFAREAAEVYEYPISSAEVAAALADRGYKLSGELPPQYQKQPPPDEPVYRIPEIPRVPIITDPIRKPYEPILDPYTPVVPPITPYGPPEALEAPPAQDLPPTWLWIAGLLVLYLVARDDKAR